MLCENIGIPTNWKSNRINHINAALIGAGFSVVTASIPMTIKPSSTY